jgi:hypothetical protein
MQYVQKVWIDFSNFNYDESAEVHIASFKAEILGQIANAFHGTNVEITIEDPVVGNFKHIDVNNLFSIDPGIHGVAEANTGFSSIGNAHINLQNIFDYCIENDLDPQQGATYIANVITHEIGHLLDLEHTDGDSSVMRAHPMEADWSEPPHFDQHELTQINASAVLANQYDDGSFDNADGDSNDEDDNDDVV